MFEYKELSLEEVREKLDHHFDCYLVSIDTSNDIPHYQINLIGNKRGYLVRPQLEDHEFFALIPQSVLDLKEFRDEEGNLEATISRSIGMNSEYDGPRLNLFATHIQTLQLGNTTKGVSDNFYSK